MKQLIYFLDLKALLFMFLKLGLTLQLIYSFNVISTLLPPSKKALN